MAVLAVFALEHPVAQSLADFLDQRVFRQAEGSTRQPDPAGVAGCQHFLAQYRQALPVEEAAGRLLADSDEEGDGHRC